MTPELAQIFNIWDVTPPSYDKAGDFNNGLSDEEKWLLDDKTMVLFKFYDESKTKEENLDKFVLWIEARRGFDTEKDDLRIAYCRQMFPLKIAKITKNMAA